MTREGVKADGSDQSNLADLPDAEGRLPSTAQDAGLDAASQPGAQNPVMTDSAVDALITAHAGAANPHGVFVSAEQTGTGSEQTVAHGLGAIPSKVLVGLTEFTIGAEGGSVDVAEGTHTTTNVLVTVTTGAKFKVMAIK